MQHRTALACVGAAIWHVSVTRGSAVQTATAYNAPACVEAVRRKHMTRVALRGQRLGVGSSAWHIYGAQP